MHQIHVPISWGVALHDIDLNLFVALEALLDARAVAPAAQRVGVTPSAMSHTLARLRRTLGDQLLVRGRGGFEPTPRALALEPSVRRALAELSRALEAEPFVAERARHRFTIAGTDYTELLVGPPLVHHARAHAPLVDFDFVPDPLEPVAPLQSGVVDVVVSSTVADAPGIVGRLLFRDGFACLVRKEHPRIRRRLTRAAFIETPHVLFSPRGSEGLGVVDRALEEESERRRVAVRIRHASSAAMLVAQSDLLLTLPRRAANVLAAQFDLRCLTPPVPLPEFSMRMSWHQRFADDPAHTWLREALVASVGPRRT